MRKDLQPVLVFVIAEGGAMPHMSREMWVGRRIPPVGLK